MADTMPLYEDYKAFIDAVEKDYKDTIREILQRNSKSLDVLMSYLSWSFTHIQAKILLIQEGATIDERLLLEACYSFNIHINTPEFVALLLQKGANVHAQDDEALIRASHSDNIDLVSVLLINGANVHAQDDDALCGASRNGNISIIKILLTNGANVHVKKDTPFRFACMENHFECASFLLTNGANIHAENDEALKKACFYDYYNIVELLLTNGADIHAVDISTILRVPHKVKNILPLFIKNGKDIHADNDKFFRALVSSYRDYDVSKSIILGSIALSIDNGADVNANECEALLYAVKENYIDLARVLLNKNADIHCKKDEILIYAMNSQEHFIHDRTDMIALLLEKGANIHVNNEEPLFVAIKSHNTNIALLLINKGADINHMYLLGGYSSKPLSVLYFAIKYKEVEVAKLLIDKGANITTGLLSLACAIDFDRKQEYEIIKCLLEHDVDVNENNGKPLISICEKDAQCNINAIAILLSKGANVHAQDDKALLYASKTDKSLDVIKLLLDHGANPRINNDILLLIAVRKNNLELVELLLDKGVNPHIRNDEALKISISKHYSHITKLLYFYKDNADEEDTDDENTDDENTDDKSIDTYLLKMERNPSNW